LNENRWQIAEGLFFSLVFACPNGGTILELGSGNTTKMLSQFHNVISIEHDPAWLKTNNKPENYIHVPLVDDFYDFGPVADRIRGLKYDVLFIDGPNSEIRTEGFARWMHIFNKNVPWFFDDTAYRRFARGLIDIEDMRGKKIIRFIKSFKEWGLMYAD